MTKLLLCLLVGCTSVAERPPETAERVSINVGAPSAQQPAGAVTFYLRNDKGRFRNVNFVVYRPGEPEAQVQSSFLMPWQRFKFTLPVGTKVYVATKSELQHVNAGYDLREEQSADLTVRADDEGQIYSIKK